jgi:hypothetical protein
LSTPAAELKRRVRLILSQVRGSEGFYKYRTPDLVARRARVGQFGRDDDPPLIEAPGDAEMAQEQVLALRTLYAQSPPTLQKQFPSLLMANSSVRNAAVVVHAMVEIGALVRLAAALKEKKAKDRAKRLYMWQALRTKIAHESHRFSEADLTVIEEARVAELARTQSIAKRYQDRREG